MTGYSDYLGGFGLGSIGVYRKAGCLAQSGQQKDALNRNAIAVAIVFDLGGKRSPPPPRTNSNESQLSAFVPPVILWGNGKFAATSTSASAKPGAKHHEAVQTTSSCTNLPAANEITTKELSYQEGPFTRSSWSWMKKRRASRGGRSWWWFELTPGEMGAQMRFARSYAHASCPGAGEYPFLRIYSATSSSSCYCIANAKMMSKL